MQLQSWSDPEGRDGAAGAAPAPPRRVLMSAQQRPLTSSSRCRAGLGEKRAAHTRAVEWQSQAPLQVHALSRGCNHPTHTSLALLLQCPVTGACPSSCNVSLRLSNPLAPRERAERTRWFGCRQTSGFTGGFVRTLDFFSLCVKGVRLQRHSELSHLSPKRVSVGSALGEAKTTPLGPLYLGRDHKLVRGTF